MRPIKNLVKYFLLLLGYDVIKINRIKEREIYNAHYLGDCFKCIKGDPLTEDILKGKVWDAQVPQLLNMISSTNGTVVEVGANIGASILPHAQQYPHLNFKLFEPVPVFYSLLSENHKTYNKKNNVVIFNQALGAHDNEEIIINVGLGTAGKTKLVHYQHCDSTLKIKSKKIDDTFKNEKISLIKIDVDGHELSVLKGGEQVLKDQHPLLFIEFATRVMDDINQSPHEITSFLKELGYDKIYIWDHDSEFIKETSDWEELIQLGRKTPHYLNILVSKGAALESK